jgi:MFS family permease
MLVDRFSATSVDTVLAWTASISSLSGFLFGYDTAIVAGALPFIRDDPTFGGLGPSMLGLIVSSCLFGAVIGSLCGGLLADMKGRYAVIVVADVLFVVGSLSMALARNVVTLLLGRVLVGIGIGASANIVPLFLAELWEEFVPNADESRGRAVGSNTVYITGGQFAAYLVALFLSGRWRLILGSAVIPAVVQAVGLRHLSMMTTIVEHDRRALPASGMPLAQLLSKKQFKLGATLHVLQQVTGINTVMYYLPMILEQAFDIEEVDTRRILQLSLIPVALNVAGSVASRYLVDMAGRRPLLLSSLVSTIVVLILMSVGFAVDAGSAFILLLVCGFIVAYSVGLGALPWTVCSEIFEEPIRGRATGLCTSCNWLTNLVVSQLFVMFRPSWAFLCIALCSCIVGSRLVDESFFPETAGLSLSDVVALFEH